VQKEKQEWHFLLISVLLMVFMSLISVSYSMNDFLRFLFYVVKHTCMFDRYHVTFFWAILDDEVVLRNIRGGNNYGTGIIIS